MKNVSYYVHIPFCKSRCYYCDFISSILKSELDVKKYVEYILKEIDIYFKNYDLKNCNLDTIYFGGGTPSLLKSDYFRIILDKIFLKMGKKAEEVTLEANPSSLSEAELNGYIKAGINRISLGVQSLNNSTLKAIGRLHDKDTAIEKIKLLKNHNVNTSVDLILGLPYQTKDDVKEFIDTMNMLNVEHISMYMLQVEDGTYLKELIEDKILHQMSDEEVIDLFNYANLLLTQYDYIRYEVSNYAKKGFESKHNSRYWEMKNYIGLGLSSHSLIDRERFYNPDNFEDYYKALDLNVLPRKLEETINIEEYEKEYVMLAFRTNKGVDIKEYKDKFNCDFKVKYKAQIEKYKGFLNIREDSVAILPEFLNVMNSIVVDFIK